MLGSLILAVWLLTAQMTTMQCQGTACQPAPGTGTVLMTVRTFPTQETCASVRQKMQATGIVTETMSTKPATSFRQTTTYTCQKGE